MRNLNIPVKAIDYVEIDEKAVRSYNAMFANDLEYKTQSVVGWNLKPDILIHGSPCQTVSICGGISPTGSPKGADEGSGTKSSLMWETIHIIQQMRQWKPKVVIWENVKGIRYKGMKENFQRYLNEMDKMGYTNSHKCLDARDFGTPQARERVFTISCLNGKCFDFDKLRHTKMKPLDDFLQDDVSNQYLVTQPSILRAIGNKGSAKRATVIKDFAWSNDNSFVLTVKINEKLFYKIVEDYQEKHHVKDRSTIYPFSIWGEFKINSLKQYIKKYNCKSLCRENFEEQNHTTASPEDYFITLKNESEAIAEIWKKYNR